MTDYNEISAHELDATLAVYREGRVVRWLCPQCEHECLHVLTEGWLYGLAPRRTIGTNRDTTTILYCVCARMHADPHEPDAVHSGCGCFFKYKVPHGI